MNKSELNRRKAAFGETADFMAEIRMYEYDSADEHRRDSIELAELHVRNADALLEALRTPLARRLHDRVGLAEGIKGVESSRFQALSGLKALKDER